MNENTKATCESEHDFALILGGVVELTSSIEDALFDAGCGDATLSMQYGLLYLEFSRSAKSLADAIISAINDVRKASIGADVEIASWVKVVPERIRVESSRSNKRGK